MKLIDLLRVGLELDYLHSYKSGIVAGISPASDTAFSARAVHTYFDRYKKLDLRFGRLAEVILLDTIDTPRSALLIMSVVFLQF